MKLINAFYGDWPNCWSYSINHFCPPKPTGLSLRDSDTRPTSLKRSPRRRKMTWTADPRRRRCLPEDTWSGSPTWFLTQRVEASEGEGNVRVAQLTQETHDIYGPDIILFPLLSQLSIIKKKHFVPVLPGIVPLSGWWTIWLKPCPYFPSIFIHFYPRPSVMWQLWKCPLKSDQNLDTS